MALLDNRYKIHLQAVVDTAGIQQQLKTISSTQKITVNYDANGARQVITTTNKMADAQGNLYRVVTKTDGANKLLTSSTTQLNRASGSLIDTFGKVLKFGIITDIIQGITSAINLAIQSVFELDAAVTEFKKVSDLSGESLDDYTKKLGEMGQQVARTRAEMVDAATTFRKSGFTDEESADLALVATMYQNVADDAISAGESADFIIAQMKAFNIEAEDSIHIIDAINEVSNNFAVSSTDLATNIGKASAALAVGGNTYEEVLGLT